MVDSAELCRNTHPDRLIICEMLLVVIKNDLEKRRRQILMCMCFDALVNQGVC